MPLLNKIDLACYIANKYYKEYSEEISPIKLQKSLYFLFAMWGGKVADAQLEGNEDTEDDETFSKYEKYLFDASFQAWRYGPVDKEIYDLFKNKKLDYMNTSDVFDLLDVDYKAILKGYIDNLLNQIFNTNDFSLVDLSHEDKCWKDAINIGVNEPIPNDNIIRDYQSI